VREAAVAAGVEPPTLHECRHGYASAMIAAGVNVKELSTFMGHANIKITLDQYGHLLHGAEDQAAGLLDAFLARQVGDQAPTVAHPAQGRSLTPEPFARGRAVEVWPGAPLSPSFPPPVRVGMCRAAHSPLCSSAFWGP
jgi:hypothetical protein